MPETRATRSKTNKNTTKRKPTKRKAREEYEDEDNFEEDVVDDEEEQIDDEDEEEVEEEEEVRVVKRGKKSPAKQTPKPGAKRKAVPQKETPAPKKTRRNPTSYQDNDDEDLEEIQEQFEEEHLNIFVSAFGHLLNDKAYADVVVRVKHGENEARGKIYAHKMLLALHSKVLKSMIDTSKEMLDGCTVISLDDEDMSYDVAYSLLEFIYRGSPKIPSLMGNAKNIIPVEKAVEKYLEPAFLACFQAHFMAPENIASYHESAEFHKNKELAVKTRKIIYECAHAISLRNVSVNTLKTFLADDAFDIEEAPLFEKVVDWAHGIIEKERGKPIKPIQHIEDVGKRDEEDQDTEIFTDQNIIAARVKLLSPLLPLIRFGRMNAEEFFRQVDKYNVLDEDELIELYPLVSKAYTPRANDPRCQERGEGSASTWLRSKHLKAIKKMLPQARPQLKQVFHAKTDQLTTFWNHCRVSPLLAVFKTTEGRIFGFYTSYKWAPNGRSKYANKTDLFMFSLGKGKRRSDFKKIESNNKRNGIPIYDYVHAGYLQLGHGHELNLTFANGQCTSQLHYCQGAAEPHVMGGTHQFSVDDAICYRVQ